METLNAGAILVLGLASRAARKLLLSNSVVLSLDLHFGSRLHLLGGRLASVRRLESSAG